MAIANKIPKVAKTTGANLNTLKSDTITTKKPIAKDNTVKIGKNSKAIPHENHASIAIKIAISFTSPMPSTPNLRFNNEPIKTPEINNKIEIPNLAHSPCQIASVSQHNKVSIIRGTTILLGTLFSLTSDKIIGMKAPATYASGIRVISNCNCSIII